MRARCPFHNEKTPSFYVSPARENYHCFGCNKGGDIFSFVEEIEGVEFREALKILAEKTGVQLVKEDPRVRSERERLLAIMEEATVFFEAKLAANALVKEYVKGRGITEETVKKFRIGFAPSAWRDLYTHLNKKKFTDIEIEKAGLSIKANRPGPNGEAYFDRFRSRVMFPITDAAGRVVAFSGRIYGEATPDTAKYINSPQTALYDKSRILFGYDKAKQAIRERDFCVCVEGQMDLVLSHQANIANTVAVSGTALTEHHLGMVSRLSKNVIFAFDADSAGVSAAGRGIEKALSMGLEVKVVGLPQGLDPADLVKQDPQEWIKRVGEAKHVVTFFLNHVQEKQPDKRLMRQEVSTLVLPYIARMGSAMEQAHFVEEVASAIGMDTDPIREDVARIARENAGNQPMVKKPAVPFQKQTSRYSKIQDELMSLLAWQESLPTPAMPIVAIKEEAAAVVGDAFMLLFEKTKESFKDVFSIEKKYEGHASQTLENLARELIAALGEESLREQLAEATKRLRSGEALGDEQLVAESLQMCQDIGRKLKQLHEKRA